LSALQFAADGRSATMGGDKPTIVEAHEKIRPLRDWMVVEPMPADLSPNLRIVEFKRNLRGLVKAVGPGHYPKCYDHPEKHKRTKMWDSMHFQPTVVQVGDIVELGMVDGDGYAFESFMWGNVRHIWVREADVSGVIEK
jgi:hypothetical protein